MAAVQLLSTSHLSSHPSPRADSPSSSLTSSSFLTMMAGLPLPNQSSSGHSHSEKQRLQQFSMRDSIAQLSHNGYTPADQTVQAPRSDQCQQQEPFGNSAYQTATDLCQKPSVVDPHAESSHSIAMAQLQQAVAGPSSPRQKRGSTVTASPRKRNSLPRNSTEALAKWFSELACWIWFSPASSSLAGASTPGTPCRSPTSPYAPLQSSPLATRYASASGHIKTRSQDSSFSALASSQEQQRTGNSATDTDEAAYKIAQSLQQAPEDAISLRIAPRQRFVTFIRDTLRTTQVSTSVLILALLYIRRLKLLHPRLRGQEGSEYRLCVTALMLGNKFLDDHTYTNKTWSDISGIALRDVTRMEVEFWLGLQMRIHVTQEEYQEWQRTLENLYEQRSQAIARRERDMRRRAAAASANSSTSATAAGFNFLGQSTSHLPHGLRHSFSHLPNQSPALGLSYTEAASPFSNAPTDNSTASALSFHAVSPYDIGVGLANSSPVSQRSMASTSATSISPNTTLRPPTAFDTTAGPKWSASASNDSAYDRSRPVSTHAAASSSSSSTTTNHNGQLAGFTAHPAWQPQTGQMTESETTLSATSSSQLKRQREDSGDQYCSPGLARKRLQRNGSGDAHGIRGQAIVPSQPLRHVHQALPSQQRYSSTAGLTSSQQSSASPLYRSVFNQPTVPDCLMQSFSGPNGSVWSAQPERQHLSFYQLAAGRDYGLPAFHLPPPPSYGPWVPSRSNSRRGSLSLSAYGISPRTGPTSGNGPMSTMNSYTPVLPRTSSGLASDTSRVSTSAPMPQAIQHRLSPEAYGLSYGSSAASADSNGLATAPTEADQMYPFTDSALEQTGARGLSSDEKRWVPFNNVPIDMQLHHLQQWQQMHYFPHVQQQQSSDPRRSYTAVGPTEWPALSTPASHLSSVLPHHGVSHNGSAGPSRFESW